MKGGAGPRRPAAAPGRGGRARRRRGPPPAALRRVGLRGLRPRRRLARRRLERAAGPRGSGGPAERERVLAGELIDAGQGRLRGVDEALDRAGRPSSAASGTCPRTSPSRSRRRRCRPTVPRSPGRSPPRSRRTPSWPPREVARGASRRRPAAARWSRETLEALLDEKLSRREVKDIQSGYKDPDRFEKWLDGPPGAGPLRRSDRAADGEGLNVGAPPGRRLVIRCDCGHDFCPPRPELEDGGARSSFATTDETLGEIYPRMAGTATPTGWSCASSTVRRAPASSRPRRCRPGYPVVHEFLPDIEGFYRGWLGREIP